MRNLVENWVESRLFEGIGRDDREFLLDIGLFDWIDAALLDEVLERNDSLRRLDTMPILVGLLEPVGGGAAESWRLHPLVREHCARRRFRETPQRYRSIHRRLAAALVRRDETVAGMRHAVEAGEPGLAGRILEDAGGARMWIRQGSVQLQAADRLLSEEIVAERPRLALVRCLSLVLSGQLEAARERYRTMAAAPRAGTEDGDGPSVAFAVEDCIVRGGIVIYSGETIGSGWTQALLGDLERLTASPDIDTPMRGYLESALCAFRHLTAEFDSALDRAARARQCLSRSPYMTMLIDIQVGQIAMAQGRVDDAGEHYRRARRVATKSFALDDGPAAFARVHLHELALECHRLGAAEELRSVPRALTKGGAPLSAYPAAAGVVIELRLVRNGVEAALGAADEMLEYVRGAGLPALVRLLSALRVSVLAFAGRAAEAERAWRLEELPEASEGCLDLSGQTWREMEALSCARLGLLIAGGRFDAARSFAAELRAVADGRGLRRTLMRALALSMVLERRAGEQAAAAGHLEAFLRLFAETPYVRPLMASVTTSRRVAPLRRLFCRISTAASAMVALKNLVTRSMAPSWTRALIVAGNCERSVMASISHDGRRKAPRRRVRRGAWCMEKSGNGGERPSGAAQEGRKRQGIVAGVVAVAMGRRRGRIGVRRLVVVLVGIDAHGVDDDPGAAVGGGHGVHRVDLRLPGESFGAALGDGGGLDGLDHGGAPGFVRRSGPGGRRRFGGCVAARPVRSRGLLGRIRFRPPGLRRIGVGDLIALLRTPGVEGGEAGRCPGQRRRVAFLRDPEGDAVGLGEGCLHGGRERGLLVLAVGVRPLDAEGLAGDGENVVLPDPGPEHLGGGAEVRGVVDIEAGGRGLELRHGTRLESELALHRARDAGREQPLLVVNGQCPERGERLLSILDPEPVEGERRAVGEHGLAGARRGGSVSYCRRRGHLGRCGWRPSLPAQSTSPPTWGPRG